VSQRLFQYEKELARVNDERLASARQLEERDALIGELRKVNAELLAQQNALQSDMVKLSQQMMALQLEPRAALVKQEVSMISGDADNPLNNSLVSGPPSLVDSENDDSSENEVVQPPRRRTRTMDLHPPGFKVLITRVSKFSGGKAADNFEVWLEDYIEATGDCGWSDQQRAQWFSWFLAGPAKSTWMHSMRSTDKTNWEAIVKVFKGEYGIHLDPRTAYQCCHELQYEQFGSVGLGNSHERVPTNGSTEAYGCLSGVYPVEQGSSGIAT